MNKYWILFLGLLFQQVIFSQTQQAWVFFTPKPNVDLELENPSAFLSGKALLRKEKYNISLDSKDLPIDQDYIDSIKKQQGILHHSTSKWFNGVFVEGIQADINELLRLSFVESIFYMDRNLNTNLLKNSTIISSAKKVKINKTESTRALNYGNTEIQVNLMNLKPLHDLGFTGKGITIAVMDAGFYNVDQMKGFDRARTNKLLLSGYDFELKTDDIYAYKGDSHGTNVLSTMLGYLENEFVGTAIDAHYHLFRTEVAESETPKEEAYWIAAAERADSLGVDIINTSLGYNQFDDSRYNYTNADMDGKTAFISQGVNIAAKKGIIVVNSAGNSGANSWRIITAPSDSPNILSVGATNNLGQKASFSSFGPSADGRIKPDIVALGRNAIVLSPNGTIEQSNGTSFSAPIAAGGVACLWQSLNDKTSNEIINIVKISSSQFSNPDNELGYGIPNFFDAYDASLKVTLIEKEEQIQLTQNPVTNFLTLNTSENLESIKYVIFNISGKIVDKGQFTESSPIDVHFLSTGFYFLRILNPSKKVIKFIKE